MGGNNLPSSKVGVKNIRFLQKTAASQFQAGESLLGNNAHTDAVVQAYKDPKNHVVYVKNTRTTINQIHQGKKYIDVHFVGPIDQARRSPPRNSAECRIRSTTQGVRHGKFVKDFPNTGKRNHGSNSNRNRDSNSNRNRDSNSNRNRGSNSNRNRGSNSNRNRGSNSNRNRNRGSNSHRNRGSNRDRDSLW